MRNAPWIVAACAGLLVTGAAAQEALVEDGNHLAALLRAGRNVVSANQPLINDAARGDKGLTPDAFMAQVRATYLDATGAEPLPDGMSEMMRHLVEAQMQAMRDVMAEAQPLLNTPDMGFKGFIPAVFARLVNERFGELVGGAARVKVTAPPALVRNRTALPDPWETAVIEERFLAADWPEGQPWYEMVDGDGGPVFRMLIPEYYSSSCLSCHGAPKGQVDVTGFPKEGGRLGDLGGAVSITLKE